MIKQDFTLAEIQQMQTYSIQFVYMKLTGEHEKLLWSQVVWGRLGLPKHQFCAWLIMQQRLQTKERLHRIGVCDDSLCLIYGEHDETHEQFFTSHFSKACITKIKTWCGINIQSLNFNQIIEWLASRRRGSKVRRFVQAAAVAATAYCIWRVRNEAYWVYKVQNINYTVKHIQNIVKARSLCCLPKKVIEIRNGLNHCNLLSGSSLGVHPRWFACGRIMSCFVVSELITIILLIKTKRKE